MFVSRLKLFIGNGRKSSEQFTLSEISNESQDNHMDDLMDDAVSKVNQNLMMRSSLLIYKSGNDGVGNIADVWDGVIGEKTSEFMYVMNPQFVVCHYSVEKIMMRDAVAVFGYFNDPFGFRVDLDEKQIPIIAKDILECGNGDIYYYTKVSRNLMVWYKSMEIFKVHYHFGREIYHKKVNKKG